jgi:hypothetical protein
MPAKKQKKMGEKRTCPECENKFTWREKHSHHQMFCSVECSAKQKKEGSGRPAIFDLSQPLIEDPKFKKLLEAFKMDCTVEEACTYADIKKGTFYDYISKNPEFSEEIESARQWPVLLARKTILNAIMKGSREASQFYLERKRRNEFATKEIIETPQPISKSENGEIDLSKLSDQQLDQWETLLEAAKSQSTVVEATNTETKTKQNERVVKKNTKRKKNTVTAEIVS